MNIENTLKPTTKILSHKYKIIKTLISKKKKINVQPRIDSTSQSVPFGAAGSGRWLVNVNGMNGIQAAIHPNITSRLLFQESNMVPENNNGVFDCLRHHQRNNRNICRRRTDDFPQHVCSTVLYTLTVDTASYLTNINRLSSEASHVITSCAHILCGCA